MNDRELDVLIAEKVMGLVPCQGKHINGELLPCHAQPDSPTRGGETHCYSTDISAAMEVVNCLRSKGVGIQISMPSHAKEYVWVEMNVPSSECQGWGNTLPEAICKCALKAFDHFNLATPSKL